LDKKGGRMSRPSICHYFAYGSNMNPARVSARGLQVVAARAGQLDGYYLTFNKMSREHAGYGHANIEFQLQGLVEGVLYELSDTEEILKMDPFERAPWNYGREAVQVEHAQGVTWAWTYFANPAVKRHNLLPPASYLEHLLAGREYLSDAYYATLEGWKATD
jgi:gamma-glutamylcyclotransferase (GGCT)/AIG2-like uncharacterized protein YtfP